MRHQLITDLTQRLAQYGIKHAGRLGKQIGSNIWIHKHYAQMCLPATVYALYTTYRDAVPHDVIRYDGLTQKLTLIQCADFINELEPTLIASFDIETQQYRYFNNNRPIYHHKWLFVEPDCDFMSVTQAMERSIEWLSLSPRTRAFTSRIGHEKFWKAWINQVGLSTS